MITNTKGILVILKRFGKYQWWHTKRGSGTAIWLLQGEDSVVKL